MRGKLKTRRVLSSAILRASSSGTSASIFSRTIRLRRPVGVGVRVVALEHDVVDADAVPHVDAGVVGDEAAEDVLAEQVRRPDVGVAAGVVAVALPRVVDALEQPRHPADAALGERDLQARELVEHRREQQLGHRELRVRAEQGDRDGEVGVGRDASARRRCRSGGTAAGRRPRAAARRLSQWSLCHDGRPAACGLSVNDTALAPLAATRCTSAVLRSASQ